MFQEERLYKILELLKEKESLSTNDIVCTFGVSRDTARRDIVKLANEGSVLRTHGGITLQKLPRISLYYNERVNDRVELKQKIAKAALQFFEPGQICFLDASTTILQLCNFAPTTIEAFSNSLDNVQALDQRGITVHVTGGTLNHQNRFLYGYETIEQISRIHYDISFIGADGISSDGFYSYKSEDAAIKRAACRMSDKVYIVTDSDKFSQIRTYKYIGFSGINGIITDKYPDEKLRKEIESQGVQFIIA